ncbi:MAG: copper-binding protein [Cytophagales bacterium]|nr:copper-binding protein [Rhizobacter sp.]
MKKPTTVLSLSLLMTTCASWATTHQPAAQPKEMQATDSAPAATDGEVRKVDMDAKKITLKHAEIKNLGMPGMTMVFQVKDPAMLEKVKAGDKVRFTAEKINGAFTVTTLDAAK